MSDGIDSELNRHRNRELFVGAAVKRLGADRRADAEILANLMTAAIDRIAAAASVTLVIDGEDFPGREHFTRQLGELAAKHAEQIAHSAVAALAEVYAATLLVAERARMNIPAA